MKILLLQDVDNVGLAGDVVKVANGYGRNYLIPQQLAVLATPSAIKQSESVRQTGELRRAREKEDAMAMANQLENAIFVFERRAGERDKLYGSVTVADIAKALNDRFEFNLDKRKIALPEPIRTLGEFDVNVKLMVGVAVAIKVIVVNEGETYTLPSATQEKADGNGATAEDEETALAEEAAKIVSEATPETAETAEIVEPEPA